MRAFAQKHGSLIKPRAGSVGPEIRGFITAAIHPIWMEGVYEGVPVVAFDYEIGFTKHSKRGSGVGVQRRVLGAQHLASDLESSQHDGWTFLYTPTRTLRRHNRMAPEEMESVWQSLLRAPRGR
ncbi:MAG TPA: hypothetical protein VGN16_12290 [Acidobacteriaceae bacterium]